MTDRLLRTAFCPQCAENFRVVVDEDEDILIACECEVQQPHLFIDELSSQLPLPEEVTEAVNKKSSKGEGSRGFQ